MIPFDGAFAAQTPQEFIDDVLVGRLGAERVSVGENFRFGHRAQGDVALLREQDAFETARRRADRGRRRDRLLEPHPRAGGRGRGRAAPPRSSAPRSTCAARSRTATSAAARSATRPPTSCPTTARGARPRHLRLPRARSTASGTWPRVNVGVRPTFETGRGVLVEAYLIDFEGDFYGRSCGSSSSAPARREALRQRRGAVEQMRRDVRARTIAA